MATDITDPAGTPTVLFVSGFHRSGTTLAATAATAATDGTTLTVGDLARRIPGVDDFLRTHEGSAPDRGVDRLPVTADTPEEYGWLLHQTYGRQEFRPGRVDPAILRDLAAELADRSGASVVVLKNPWDTGREQLLLDHVPGAGVLLVRRRIDAIEDSARRALLRSVDGRDYLRALMNGSPDADKVVDALGVPWQRYLVLLVSKWRLRVAAVRLARGVSRLPLDRVAFVSYDELRDNPVGAAAWAGHLLDPEAFGKAFAAEAFKDCAADPRTSWLSRRIDGYWARAWRRARAAQAAAGYVRPGAA